MGNGVLRQRFPKRLGFYLVDIVTDVGLAVKYFLNGHLVWAGLTLLFVVIGSTATQVFSYSWYRDDTRNPLVNPGGDRLISGMNRGGLIGLHVVQMGIFTRRSWRVFLSSSSSCASCWAMDTSPYYNVQEMPSGLPTFFYLMYKLLTISTHILSLSLFLILSLYSALGMAVLWLAGTLWAHWVHTDFCTSKSLERLYRTIVGVVLVFTFFNVKGQDTRWPMAVYYVLYALVNLSGPLLLVLVRPEAESTEYFWPITVGVSI
ncbi:unnamed protein product [Coregonus sp. 'balchen']|nr:unnamed protein product [Coregonus sp. 'balchen']